MFKKKILVTGSTGYVGSRLIPFLLDKGYQVRASSRSLDGLKKRPWAHHPNVELMSKNILDPASIAKACDGCHAVYYLVHSMNPRHKDFADADRKAAQNTIKACDQAGVKRIVYLGGLGDSGSDLSKHLASRAEVMNILHSGKTPATTLRAAMIIGTGSVSFEILRFLVKRLPIMITPKWLSTDSQPIAIRNVLNYMVDCLDYEQMANQVYDIGGPEIINYRSLIKVYAQEAKLMPRLVIPVPVLTPRLSSYWINLVTPIHASLARPLTEGLKNKMICLENNIREIISQRLLNCREAIQLAIESRKIKNYKEGEEFLPPEAIYPGDPSWVLK